VPVAKEKAATTIEMLRLWLKTKKWGMRARTLMRARLKSGDHVCFYACGEGKVVAWAIVAGRTDALVGPDEWPEPWPAEEAIYKIPLADVTCLEVPTTVDEDLRRQLDAFRNKKVGPRWSWLVQTARPVSAHDFALLIGKQGPSADS
jgi:hypothetical protein